jgi:LmbE family N-acetylglucosaminyl deacetylase
VARCAAWWRAVVASRAVDGSGLFAGRTLMVLAPHPDDETLGCGAVIARARAAGDPVTVVVATDGRHSSRSTVLDPERLARLRRDELDLACARLGVAASDIHQLDFEDGSLSGRVPELADELSVMLALYRPDVILVPCVQDHHPDHQALHLALLRAMRADPARRGLVLAYPVWTWIAAPWFLDSRPRLPLLAWSVRQLAAVRWLRVCSHAQLPAKRAALAAYASQLTNLTGEPTWRYLSPAQVALFLHSHELFLPVHP